MGLTAMQPLAGCCAPALAGSAAYEGVPGRLDVEDVSSASPLFVWFDFFTTARMTALGTCADLSVASAAGDVSKLHAEPWILARMTSSGSPAFTMSKTSLFSSFAGRTCDDGSPVLALALARSDV